MSSGVFFLVTEQVHNLVINRNRLTTPYDLHMTLQHLLVLSGKNHTIVTSDGCPKCRSLFEVADQERSCQEAAIEQHWCTCTEYSEINASDSVVQSTVQYVISMLHVNIKSTKKCAKFKLKKVIYSSVTDATGNDIHLLVVFRTKPNAVFESTVRVCKDEQRTMFKLQGSISRLDSYDSVSHCVTDPSLKKYCHCL